MECKRLLIYAINGKGMGHLNRTLVLAQAARQFNPEIQILFAVGSPLFWLVRDSGFEVLKVPDRHHALGFHVGKEGRSHHLRAIFEPIFEYYRPDSFLVDLTMSESLFREASKFGARVSAVLRKQRDTRLEELRRDPAAKYIQRFLLPHPTEEFSLQELPTAWRARARRVGAVVRSLQVDRVAEVRARYSSGQRPLVVVTIGGGGFAESYQTLRATEQAAVDSASEFDWVLIFGPYFLGDIPPSNDNVHRVRFDPDLMELCAGADVVVCNAGYNTIREIEVVGTPAVVIPLQGTGADDQHERAELFAKAGRAVVCTASSANILTQIRKLVRIGPQMRGVPTAGEPAALLGERFLKALGDDPVS